MHPWGIRRLQVEWGFLNQRFFQSQLSPITIHWSQRLTSSLGVFVCRLDHRSQILPFKPIDPTSRCIRLSTPLFQLLGVDPALSKRALDQTLAHEMIHQWQYDLLKRRPDHGPEFRSRMKQMNEAGLEVTVHHAYNAHVAVLSRYWWSCRHCGEVYRRQRESIDPRRHRCGICHGALNRLVPALDKRDSALTSAIAPSHSTQLLLPL